MNPLEQYISIIHTRQQNPLPKDQYGERHHIIPRSCGGCNAKWNVVRLTPEEHYRCHCLLPFIYVTGKEHGSMTLAWHRMRHVQGKDIEISEEEYGTLRREYSEVKAAERRGKPGGMLGKHHSEETRRKYCEDRKGRKAWNKGIPHTEEYKRKMSERCKGIPKSKETRRRMSETWHLYHHSPTEEHKRHLSELNSRYRWYHDNTRAYKLLPDDKQIEALGLKPGRKIPA